MVRGTHIQTVLLSSCFRSHLSQNMVRGTHIQTVLLLSCFRSQNPVECAEGLHETSKAACEELVNSLVNGTELCLPEHRQKVRMAGTHSRQMRGMDEKSTLGTERQ